MQMCAVIKINQTEKRERNKTLIGFLPGSQCLDMLANASDAFHYFLSRRAWRDRKSFSTVVGTM